MHNMWWDKDPSETPYRPQSYEQQYGKHNGVVSSVSQNGTREQRRLGQGKSKSGNMHNMREGIPTEKKQAEGEAIMREQELLVGNGETIGRTAMGVVARVERLEALGNGQVPHAMALAWETLGGGMI